MIDIAPTITDPRTDFKHGQVWITPSGEYAVLMSYDFHATATHMTRGQYMSMKISEGLSNWLEIMGAGCSTPMDYTSDDNPWRHRCFIPGTDGLHAFFFYRRKNAALFKLRWT